MKIPNEDKGLNKRRHAMPQIVDFDAFVKDLDDEGHAIVTLTLDPTELTPTQGNFNEDKVSNMIRDKSWGGKPIITSDDDFVLDGHHRWLAAVQEGKTIKARVVDMDIEALLDFVKGKPYVKTRTLNEDMGKQLLQVQNYYARVAKGEGGEQFARMLNKLNLVRQSLMDGKDQAMKNRVEINRLLERVQFLLTEPL